MVLRFCHFVLEASLGHRLEGFGATGDGARGNVIICSLLQRPLIWCKTPVGVWEPTPPRQSTAMLANHQICHRLTKSFNLIGLYKCIETSNQLDWLEYAVLV